jgi:hypothetical protein
MSDSTLKNPTPQFGTAEYLGSPGNDHCQFCHQPIAGSYYRVNDAMACSSCAEQMRGELAKDTHAAFVRGILFGVGAAIVGLALYATFAIVTGIVIGYASLAVGWMVGTAIMKGSKGVGGRRYQIAAVLLTYAAVSMAAIPIWIHYAGEQKANQTQQQRSESASSDVAEQNQQSSSAAEKPRMTLGAWLVRVSLLGLASPFLEIWEGGPSFSWLIGLVILFVGMKFAWRITAGRPLEIFGPFDGAPQISR